MITMEGRSCRKALLSLKTTHLSIKIDALPIKTNTGYLALKTNIGYLSLKTTSALLQERLSTDNEIVFTLAPSYPLELSGNIKFHFLSPKKQS